MLKEKSLKQLLKTGSVVTHGDYAACDAFDVRDRIAQISVPTLVVCGREDRMTPLKFSEYLAQRLPSARLVVIEHAGHMTMLEQPASLNVALRE